MDQRKKKKMHFARQITKIEGSIYSNTFILEAVVTAGYLSNYVYKNPLAPSERDEILEEREAD